MKKWIVTILIAIALLAVCLTAPKWLPWLALKAKANKESVDALKGLVDLFSKVFGWIPSAALILWKWLHDKKTQDKSFEDSKTTTTITVEKQEAGKNAVVAGHDANIGGDTSVSNGDVIHGDKHIHIHQEAKVADSAHPTHQLPPPPADFTGRTTDLQELAQAIRGGGATISGLAGQGGVGKTALALKLGAELASDFPDGQIYLDLLGVSANPVTTQAAMGHVIRAFRDESKLPEGEAELAALYRDVLHGSRVLLLMDNAKDAEQVQALAPPKGCALLITSRLYFTLPGLHPKRLDVLSLDDAKALLLEIAPRIGVHAETIAKACGCLPLALRITATALAERDDLDPAERAAALATEKGRLSLLGKGDKSVEASIGLSYRLFDEGKQMQWRMLGVFPGSFEPDAAAAIWEMKNVSSAKDLLSELRQYSMLEWNEKEKRYRLHDLMRDFARERMDEMAGELRRTELLHARHYLEVLSRANGLYSDGGESVLPGLKLFDLEEVNIRAGQAWAARHSKEDDEATRLCNEYPNTGYLVLPLRLHQRKELIPWTEAALAVAQQLHDKGYEGAHLGNLGLAYDGLGEYRRAIEYQEQRLKIAQEIGDRQGEGQSLGNLGNAYDSLGEYRRAIEYQEQHRKIAQEIGDRQGEGQSLGNLGNAYDGLGEYRRAIEYHEQCLKIAQEIGDRRGEGQSLGNLGNAYDGLGEYRRAIEYQEQSLKIAQEIGDRQGEGQSLGNLGNAYDSLGEYRRAIQYHEQNRKIAQEIGDRLGEGNALGNLGSAYHGLGEYRRAIEYQEQHRKIAQEIGDRRGEGNALWNMSLSLDKLHDRKKAIEQAEAALVIYESIEAPAAAKVRRQLEVWRNVGK